MKVDPNTNPETRTVTTEKWVGVDPNMVSAVMDKETGLLTLVNVKGATDTDEYGNVNIALNNALRSLVFVGDIEDADGKVTRRYVGQVPTILVENFSYTALKLKDKDNKDGREKAEASKVKNATGQDVDEVLDVQPTTYAYYHVNPSTANVEDLKNLVFDINANGDCKDFNVTPEFVEFKDGILVVKVLMEGTPATAEKISTVALQATKNNEETVTSDFVQIYKGSEAPVFRIAKSLRGEEDALVDWDFRRAYITNGIKGQDADAGKGVTTGYVVTNKKVWDITSPNQTPGNQGKDIDLCLNYKEEFNLNDSIELHDKSGTPHKYISLANALKKYNLEVSYEVVKNYKLGEQKTDQADFITLTGSVVKSKVYDDGTSEDPQLAAIGRTPIIRATLTDKTNNKIVEIAYIKIKWVKEANAVSGEHEIAMTKAFEFNCADQNQSTTIQQTNIELYNQFGYDHATFNAVFTKFLPYNSEKLVNASDDEMKEAKDGYWAIHAEAEPTATAVKDKTYIDNVGKVEWVEQVGDQSETTYILKWTITADEMWLHGNGDIAHTVVFSNESGTNKIAVTLTSSITKVAKEYDVKPAADYIAQYWVNSTEYAKFNVSVPTSTSDNSAANCKFVNDLNSPFTTKNGILYAKDYRQLSSIKYFFDNDENHGMQKITKMAGHDVGFKVSGDRLTLQARVKVGNNWSQYEDIAIITNSSATNNVKNVVTLQNTSTIAKILLNDQTAANPFYALYVAEGKVCEDASGTGADNTAREVEITFNGEDHFKASWTRPINIAAMSADNLIDGVDFTEYGSYVRIEDLIDPADWRDRKFSNFNNYWGFYGVENVLIDTNNAKANFGNGWVELPTNLVVGQDNIPTTNIYYTNKPELDDNGQIKRDPNTNRIIYKPATSVYGFFTYKNNGTTLLDDFQIQVTVKVTYKWGEITSAPIIVPVKNIGNVPTSAPQM